MSKGIFLCLGSNLGDCKSNLKEATGRLGMPVIAASSIYESEPMDYTNQPWFLNQVIRIETELDPLMLLKHCQSVENQLGRTREIAKGPRTIDIDLLFYNEQIIKLPELTIPHPGIPARRFVLTPLHEVAADFIHPELQLSIRKLLETCPDHSEVKRIEPA